MHLLRCMPPVCALVFVLAALAASPVLAQTSDLLFSEYVEGSSYNKAVEIYNGTGATVDLSAYTLELYSNGSASPSQSTALAGTLAEGDVYVLSHGSAGAEIAAVTDQVSSAVINFNGDDALVLRKNGVVIDAIGRVGEDPGSQWGSGLASTQDNTLRRLATACTGDTNPDDAFDPAALYEGFANDTFDGLGAHTADCGGGTGNTPPVFTAELASQTVEADAPFSFTYAASDADNDALTFGLVEGPETATLDASSGLFEWTPSADDAGLSFPVTVSVFDGTADVTTSATLTVGGGSTGTAIDLFFSEYVEGSSNNKAVEIFNGTGAEVDLGTYSVELYSNGATSPNTAVVLSGTLADGAAYVIANSSATADILAVANLTSGVANFNGDDALVLRIAEGPVVDVIGRVGEDPGSQWGSGLTSTQDNTLRRKPSSCAGDTDPNDAFDPALDYDGYAIDTFDGLGAHVATCEAAPENEAPVFTATLPDALVDGGASFAFTYAASDADGDALTYTLAEGPDGATFDAATGDFAWTASAPGVYAVSVSVSDGTATTTARTVLGVRGTLFPGEEGATLRESIRGAYTPALTLGYDVARDTMYANIDREPDGSVVGVYSGFSVVLPEGVDPSAYLAANGINAEHTWPQSMGAEDEPGRSDMHNLFPAKDNVNSARSNKPYAEIPDVQTETWYRLAESQTTIPDANIDEYAESASGYFEPRELHKGNAARAALYFFSVYEALADRAFLLVQKDALTAWNGLDPADVAEVVRTAEIAQRQGNVNPFLIDPTLADRAVSDIMPPDPITIAEARALSDGAFVTVDGVVTRAAGRFTRIQDTSGDGATALTTFQAAGSLKAAVEAGEVEPGDRIRVTGSMDTFNGLRQIVPALYEVLEEDAGLPAPQLVTLAEIEAEGESYESELIRVVGLRIDDAGDDVFAPNKTYTVADQTTGSFALRTPASGDGSVVGSEIPEAYFAYQGVLGEFRGTYQLSPTYASDIQPDTTAPVITVATASLRLFPPNGRYEEIDLASVVVSVTDDQQGELSTDLVRITRVTSDEAENGTADGNTVNDIVIGAECASASLRAERQETGDGRVYTLTLAVGDASGNVGTATYEVHVPVGRQDAVVAGPVAYAVDGTCAVAYAPLDPVGAVAARGDQVAASAEVPQSASRGESAAPTAFAIEAMYPNPFVATATVAYALPEAADARLVLYDLLGRTVAVLAEGPVEAGRYEATLDGRALPSGTYLVRMTTASGFAQTKRITLVR